MNRPSLPRWPLAALLCLAATARADEFDGFEKHIRPILVDNCQKCHGPDKSKGGLRLDSRDAVLKGGDSGPALVPKQPAKSLLLQAVKHVGDAAKMPPEGKLTDAQIRHLETWIASGAPDPRVGGPVAASLDIAKARSFWSFQPVRAATPPTTPADATAIDRFLHAKRAEKNLTPVGPADRRTLVRRVTFDLTGLPPTPAEVEAFVADNAPDAYAKLVDRLLDSPAYGEKWGRHWLDLVRYADTSGCNSDYPVPDAHKYRDYVIRAFNADKPFDRFVREQIAGDLMPATTDAERDEHRVATGYLAVARRYGSLANEMHLTYEDAIDNMGKTFLGLSLGCARCHDHKFDPVPTADYYALYGILQSTTFSFPGTEIFKHAKDFVALGPPEDAETLRKYEASQVELDVRMDKLLEERRKLDAAVAAGHVPAPGERTSADIDAERKATETKQDELARHRPAISRAYGAFEGKPTDAAIQRKGDPKSPGEVVRRGFLQVFGGRTLSPDAKGSGRRELADWLVDNPLTARVFVNRVWQHHFGRGLVATPNDFGVRGDAPSHPELLDHLAERFVAGGWSVKALHREILATAAYRMSSANDDRDATLDANNVFLWRYPRRRLEAEEVRDTLLFVAGTLDRSPAGAHPFPPEAGFKYTQHKPFVAVYPSSRRSVYLMQQRLRRHPFLDVFDGPDPNATTAARTAAASPLQALFHMNDEFAHAQALAWATRLEAAATDDAGRIDAAYRAAFARPPRPEEVAVGVGYLNECRAALPESSGRAAWASYCRVLMSGNEFAFVD